MKKLNEAVEYLWTNILSPVYSNAGASKKMVDKAKNAEKTIRSFNRVGDLIAYISRFEPGNATTPIVDEMREAGIPTFEDYYYDFLRRFGRYSHDRTRLSDFVVGEVYSTADLVNFAQLYDPRTGGIFTIGSEKKPEAVFLKATLDGTGEYPNEWLIPGKVLKYYMQGKKPKGSVRKVFKKNYKMNQAVIKSGSTPLYVFNSRRGQNTLVGLFRYEKHVEEPNGDKWFQLVKRDAFDHQNPTSTKEVLEDLERNVKRVQSDTPEQRAKRLREAPKKPKTKLTLTTSYERNADVIAEVLIRADGICERCSADAPFIRKKDNTPYLEVHHIVTLADGGDDTVDNALALCPNCHRELHFGISSKLMI